MAIGFWRLAIGFWLAFRRANPFNPFNPFNYMDRRKFIRASLLGSAALGLGGLAMPALGKDNEVIQLTVLHTNDMHSRIDPFPKTAKEHAGMGGMARRAALIDQIRREGNEVLLLDAGDVFQGTPYFNFFEGSLEFELMSKMGYDTMTLGNHDFDAGIEGLVKQLPKADFDIVNANYSFEDDALKQRVKPYRIFKKEALKVGVFGVGIQLEGLVLPNLYGGTKYADPIGVAREMAQELRKKGCHLVICLSHLGNAYDNPSKISDAILAQKVDGIDLILGGHTHTFLPNPLEYQSPEGRKVLVNQVGWAGINLGRIDFFFSKSLKKEASKGMALKLADK